MYSRRLSLLSWDADAVAWLVEAGLDPKYGARPLQRAIEQHVIVPLSYALLEVTELGTRFVLRRGESGLVVEVH